MSQKNTFFIIGITIVVVLLLAVGVYFLFFAQKAPGITVDTGTNPFGTGGDFVGIEESVGQETDTGVGGEEVAPHLVKITEGPVAYGSIVFLTAKVITAGNEDGLSTSTPKTETVLVPEVRYIERQSGNVYAYELNERILSRISNRTLPGIQEAVWTPDGRTAFLRFISKNDTGQESIETYALPAEGEGGYFLETGLDQVVMVGSSTVVTLLPSSSGSIATEARADGANAKTLFSSNLSSLRLYPAGTGLVAYTKASAQADGYGFTISSSGAFDRVLGPQKGLTLLPSPSGKSVLYSYVSGNTVTAGVLDTKTRATITVPVATLPEKCVWAHDDTAVYCSVPRAMNGTWPDSWYQGVTSFSDRIWKIDMAERSASLVIDPIAVAQTQIDGVSLALDPKSDFLIFTNKIDGSLWAYDL